MSDVGNGPTWSLTLYVSGASPRSATAIENVRKVCGELEGDVELRVIDVHDAPALAISDGVVAIPTLVKKLPLPLRRLIGDLSDGVAVRERLNIQGLGE